MVAAIVGHVTFSAHPRNRNPVLLAPHRQDQQPPQPGKLIRPIIEITGYPAALKEIAPPPPALPVALLSTKR